MKMKQMGILMMLAMAVGASAQGKAFSDVRAMKGQKPSAWWMKGVNGQRFTSQSLKGKVVVLDFWATWCGPCKLASPTMQKLHQKYASKGLVVIGANITDGIPAVKKYAKDHGYTYNFTQGNDDLSNAWGIQGIPAFIFIDKKGVVQRVDTGFSPEQSPAMFEATVKKLLAAK